MIGTLRTKAWIYVALANAGFAVSVVALVRAGTSELGRGTFGLLLAGVGLLYAAFVFSVATVWLPLRPWLARYERFKSWHHWVLHELPTLLALIPVLVSAVKIFKAAWGELKGYQEKGELNVQNLAAVAQKFATEAESLSRQPGVELAKKKIKEAA